MSGGLLVAITAVKCVLSASVKNFFDVPMGRRDWLGISKRRVPWGRQRAFPGSSKASSDRGCWTTRPHGNQPR